MKQDLGFTLVELLVAMAIVAVIGIMALTGLSTVIQQQSIAQERSGRWREIQFAMRVISQDLAQIHPRPTREEFGEAWIGSVNANPNTYALEFTRGGWANPAVLPRGSVLRVAYDAEDNTLIRFNWSVMDRTAVTPPIRTVLLTGVEEISVRLIDINGEAHLEWPPATMSGMDALIARPRAVEFRINLEDFGWIWRSVETS
ncbi:MAG: type II secretion system minor pseudopilin GspJ [Candidatus Rariloculaceae bacterium]